jgi:DNA-binding transcriptional LysR family regulator
VELRHLRHFTAIVELGSFSRAAEQFALTQSALTRSIKTLEESIGIGLLKRGASGATATRGGAALYEYAKFLLHEADRIRADVHRAAADLEGSINLAVNPTLAESFVPQALSAFAEKYDRLSIQIEEGDIEETVPLLISGQIDLIISTVPASPMRSNLKYERLGSVEWQFYGAHDHPLAGKTVMASPAFQYRWTLLDRQHEIDFIARHLATRNEGMPNDAVRTGSMALMRLMIVQCGMIGWMPTHYMASTDAVPLPALGPPVQRPVGLLLRADARVSHALREFSDIFRNAFTR